MLSQGSLHHALSPSPAEWISDYEESVLDPEALRMEVDAFMEAYDKKIAEVGLQQGHGTVLRVAPVRELWWPGWCHECGLPVLLKPELPGWVAWTPNGL